MQHQGYDHGSFKPVLVKRGLTAVTNGGTTVVPLDDLPSEDEGMPLGLLGFYFVLPNLTATLTSGKHLDAVSLSQTITNFTIQMAKGCPPSEYEGGDRPIDNLDFYTVMMLLQWQSGVPVFVGNQASGSILGAPSGTSVTTQAGVYESQTLNRRFGWPHLSGASLGKAVGGTAAWSDAPRIFVPLHMFWNEDYENTACPNGWYNGVLRDGSRSGSGGKIEIALGTSGTFTMDGIVGTWSTNTMDVWALCLRQPRERITVPCTPRITRLKSSDRTFKLRSGIRMFGGFMKQLTGAGAMQTHTPTKVHVTCDGRQLTEDDLDVNQVALSYQARREEFRIPQAETDVGTNLAAARKARFCIPVLMNDGSSLRAPGSTTATTLFDVVTPGNDTSFDIVDYTLTPRDAKVRERAKLWGPIPGAEIVASGKNGNPVPGHVADLIPARAVVVPNAPAVNAGRK